MRHTVEYRQPAWLEIHHAVPLALIVITLVVYLGETDDAVVSRLALLPILGRNITGRSRIFLSVASQLPIKEFIVHLSSSLHRIFE